ncbi:apolipoprotein N-acyltransferase [Shimia aestuarii]|nr:apolipoprotein N-acyltransferase [Shimia aestuarii]
MTSKRRARWQTGARFWQDFLMLAGAGAVAGLGHPPFDLWFLTVAGLAFAVWSLGRSGSARQAWWQGWGLGTGYFAVSIHWIVEPFFVDPVRHGWMAPFAILFMAVGLGLFWAVAFLGARRIGRSVWPVAVFLTLAEMVRAYLFGGFPWGMPSYVLVDSFTGQLAAWIGPHGLNLLVFALACGLATGAAQGGVVRIGAGGSSLVALALMVLPAPEADTVAPDAPVIRLIQPNAPQHQKWDPAHIGRFFDRSILFTRLGAPRPDLIVWPETSVPTLLGRATNTLAVIAEAAEGVPVVLGINRVGGERVYNSAVLMDGTGAVTDIYDKHHLVPFGEYVPLGDLMSRFGLRGFASQHGEGYSPGPGPQLMDLGPLGKALPLICYEAVFPQDVNGAPERPEFLLQITNDAWFGNFSGPYQHLAQARMRAIEQGLPMVRAANTGVSAMIDARGKVIASLPLNEDGFLDVALPAKRAKTPYARMGDWPLAVLLAILSVWLMRRARRESD